MDMRDYLAISCHVSEEDWTRFRNQNIALNTNKSFFGHNMNAPI